MMQGSQREVLEHLYIAHNDLSGRKERGAVFSVLFFLQNARKAAAEYRYVG